MDRCELKAYAKINLGLDVVRRLENGYHEVKMVMQTVDIYDVLTLEKIPSEELAKKKSVSTDEAIIVTTDSGELPTDENNLIYKAARLMRERFAIEEGVRIHLNKNIPIAAGMAGGSTDAAATLKGMKELFHLTCTLQDLQQIGVKIGADVPYCVMGGTALAEGIGEVLTPLVPAPDCFLVVAKPDINVSTKYVYEHLDASPIKSHPDIDGMVASIAAGDLTGIIARLGNVLESVTVTAYPIIETIKTRMLESGAQGSLMSGSGPTVFGIFEEEETARKAYEQIQSEGLAKQVFITTFC